VFLAAAFAATALVPRKAGAEAAIYACADKGKRTQLSYPLTYVVQRFALGQPVTIVTPGSSSTAGIGFALGRTSVWDAPIGMRDRELTRDAAVARIAARCAEWIEVLTAARAG
jgi:hypothetical protein